MTNHEVLEYRSARTQDGEHSGRRGGSVATRVAGLGVSALVAVTLLCGFSSAAGAADWSPSRGLICFGPAIDTSGTMSLGGGYNGPCQVGQGTFGVTAYGYRAGQYPGWCRVAMLLHVPDAFDISRSSGVWVKATIGARPYGINQAFTWVGEIQPTLVKDYANAFAGYEAFKPTLWFQRATNTKWDVRVWFSYGPPGGNWSNYVTVDAEYKHVNLYGMESYITYGGCVV